MSDIKFTPNQAALDRLLRARGGPVDTYMASVADQVVAEAKIEAPEHTVTPTSKGRPGELKRSIHRLPTRRHGYRVIASTFYAYFVHEGTKPHIIVPKPTNRSGKLRFYWDKEGGIVFRGKVRHPGTKPDRFLLRALHKVIR